MQTIDRVAMEQRVRTVTERMFGVAARSVNAGASLADTLPGFTSLKALDLIMAMEEEFGIEVDFVSDDVRHTFSTLHNIANYVQERLEDNVV
jgi:acyl carrier protein